MWKVRFNLGKGCRYMTWKITDPEGAVQYIDPEKVTLLMSGIELRNSKATAQKIYDGANKTVCAFVSCENVLIADSSQMTTVDVPASELRYNPRKAPHWTCDSLPGKNMDNEVFNLAITKGRKIFTNINNK